MRYLAVFLCALVILCTCRAGEAAGTAAPAAVKRGAVILVEFPDVPHKATADFAAERFRQKLDGYIREMSYGQTTLQVDITSKWYRLPDGIGRYRISSRNPEVDKSRLTRLINDSLRAADQELDFSRYEFVVLFLGARVQEYGMIGLCGFPGMLGWQAEGALTDPSGEPVKGGAIFCYQAHLGTLFHDVAHILGGVVDGKRRVPCLYDHDLQAKPGPQRDTFLDAAINMGSWDPMSCHFYKWELPPPGISSWTRLRLGWLDPAKVRTILPGETVEVILNPLEDPDGRVLAIKIPLSASTYYLVENRQPLGFDRNLSAVAC